MKRKPTKPIEGWVVTNLTGHMIFFTFAWTRRDSINKILEYTRDPWKVLYREGFRCIKATLVPGRYDSEYFEWGLKDETV